MTDTAQHPEPQCKTVEKKSVAILRSIADTLEVKLAEHNLSRLREKHPPLHSYEVISLAISSYIASGALD